MRVRRAALALTLLAALGACASGGGAPKSASDRQAVSYEVRPGDTLSGIAARYRVDMRALAWANGLRPPYLIRVGQRLTLPRGGAPAPAYASRPAVQPAASAPSAQPAPLPRAQQPAPLPRPAGAPRLVWPADGPVSAGFGAGGDRGIVIDAHQGAAVRSAAAGTVIFAGHEPGPYGVRVLVDHGGGWVSAYGHLSRLVVSAGERVAAGARLGFVGATGSTPSPRLHFELRHGGGAADPLPLLPPRL